MATDAQALTLMQWLSPAYPLGSFAYSHGIEAAVAGGHLRDAGTLRDWIADVLTHGSGRSDAVLMRLAHAPDADVAALDAVARAYAPAAERLREGARQGAAFARTTRAVWGIDLPDLMLPVAMGRAARLMSLDIDLAVPMALHAFAANLVSCAQRLLPLGQTAAQRIVADLIDPCRAVAAATRGTTEDDLWSVAWMSDIAAMRHETLQPRIFQS